MYSTVRLLRQPLLSTFRRHMWHQQHNEKKIDITLMPLKLGKLPTKTFEEIRIKVPWGHIAGKWYGPKHVRPLVGVHGWQDNAGTFDTLAPLLPSQLPFVCFDMPGHGHSSWYPDGVTYHSIDYVVLIRSIMDHFNWEKISLLGHSMSAINSFVFAAMFPNKVDLLISLDVVKPLIRSAEKIVDCYAVRLDDLLKVNRRSISKSEPPTYDWEELIERLHIGTQKSVDRDCCEYLLLRNVQRSKIDANKFYFSRDSRLKASLFYTFSPEVTLEMARRITCPHVFIKASDAPLYEALEYHEQALELLNTKSNFEYHEVPGTHHVHLNDPHKISDIINPFLLQHRNIET